ncbi:MAG TPA: amidohydrolase family protein [Stellaceae bacterium]|nr:amidohydrolase family protein [Stellaceae bacterium]
MTAGQRRIILRGCHALLGRDAVLSPGPVDIILAEGRIRDIRPSGGELPGGEIVAAENRLAAPGLVNGHYHSHEHFQKGRYDNLPLELWMNYVRPFAPLPLTARHVYLRTLVGAIEALRSGTTTIVDDMNVSPVLRPDHVEAAFRAYEDIGLRAYLGLSLMDKPFYRSVPFLEEECPAELLRRLDAGKRSAPEEIFDYASDLAANRNPKRHRVGFVVAPSAPQRCTTDFLRRCDDLAERHDLPLIIHAQETRLQVVTGHLLLGATPIEHLHRIGFLGKRVSLIHAVWLTPAEIELVAEAGASVQHNPVSNLKLGSGLAPLRALLDAGVNVSLGSDGCGSIETANMQGVVAATALLHKLRGDDFERWVGAKEAWRAGTLGGAAALGRAAELGALEVGCLADLALYRLDRIPFVPLNDPLRQLVFAETGASLDTVLVDGRIVMREGRLTGIDEAAVVAEIAALHAELRPLIDGAEKAVEAIRPVYERIYRRCLTHPLAADTYAARL